MPRKPWPAAARQKAHDDGQARRHIQIQLGRLGDTIFTAAHANASWATAQFEKLFLPASLLNALRREAVAALEAARLAALPRWTRACAVEPPMPYPEDSLSYLANVFNQRARDFYARHAVKLIARPLRRLKRLAQSAWGAIQSDVTPALPPSPSGRGQG